MKIKSVMALAAGMALLAGGAMAQSGGQSGDWRTVAPENLWVIDTAKGRVLVELEPRAAPNHIERIRTLTNQGFYDGLKFHRVIPDFMAQTGDPKGTGEGGSELPDLKAEFTFRRDAQTPFAAVAAPAGALMGFVQSLPVQTQPDAVMRTTADGKVHAWGLYCPGVAGMARDDATDWIADRIGMAALPRPTRQRSTPGAMRANNPGEPPTAPATAPPWTSPSTRSTAPA